MSDAAPNARITNDDESETVYGRLFGDTLKIRWKAHRKEGSSWIDFSPADLLIELNGVPLTTCTGVSIDFRRMGFPKATLSFTLQELDIDAETMVALQAFVDNQVERNARGEGTRTTD